MSSGGFAQVWRQAGVLTCGLALSVSACSGSPDVDADPSGDDRRAERERTSPAPVAAPTNLSARIEGDGSYPILSVTFAESPDAEYYEIERGGDQDPLVVSLDECVDGQCEVTMNRLAAEGAKQLTAVAVVGERRSEPSEPVEVPEWPDSPAIPERSPGDPYTLTIYRITPDGRLDVESETVPADEVDKRVAELEAEDEVIGVGRNGDAPVMFHLQRSERQDGWRDDSWHTIRV